MIELKEKEVKEVLAGMWTWTGAARALGVKVQELKDWCKAHGNIGDKISPSTKNPLS
jgi:hypothetical protein